MQYLIILAAVLIISPFVILAASNQDKKFKSKLRLIFIALLSLQIFSGFSNWEAFSGRTRTGFELVGLFFVISFVQILLLLQARAKTDLLSVILNFINTVIIFTGLIRIGNITGIQAFSLASLTAVFATLINNVVGLTLINKDKDLLSKYPWSPKASKLKQTKVQQVITWVAFCGVIIFMIILFIAARRPEQQNTQVPMISSQQALESVRNLPEVQDYLQRVPNAIVDVDNELDGEYNIHVYEVKNEHTATFNWYRVDIETGAIKAELEFPTDSPE